MNIVLDGHKLQWHGDRVETWLKGERIAPIAVELAITRRCNYNCKYCYGKLQENEVKLMSFQTIKNFLDDAAKIGVKSINFTGDGENTCSPFLTDAIIYGKSKGLDIALGTNGYLLVEDKLKDILTSLTYIRFNFSAGTPESYKDIHGFNGYYRVTKIIKECVRIKKEYNLPVTIGMQMVLMPDMNKEVISLTKLGKELGVDYLVIKHCSDDEFGSLGIDYTKYDVLVDLLKEAETYSTDNYLVKAKWSKLLSGGKRDYDQCYGPPFMLQISGSGLVAPCGMLFNDRYKDLYHIGNITETRFEDIWKSDRYWEVMTRIASKGFNAHTMCGSLCYQHKINEYLWDIKTNNRELKVPHDKKPQHINFV